VVALAALSWAMHLGLGSRMLVSAARTVVQLLLLGLVLEYLFAHASLWLVAGISAVMVLIAGHEVMARQQRAFRGWWGYGLGTLSMFISAFAITLYALHAVVQPAPWFAPQYAIPLLGMMLGNTMNGVALTLERLTQSAWQQQAVIEARLLLGQEPREAMADILRESVRTGLIPVVNAMAAAGIISIPGMMTGQVLAGNAPINAAMYQILIMFMIAAGTGFAAVAASWLGARRLFDERQRLRLDRLRAPRR
jgi:putative ABC transport system permease protein